MKTIKAARSVLELKQIGSQQRFITSHENGNCTNENLTPEVYGFMLIKIALWLIFLISSTIVDGISCISVKKQRLTPR